MCLQCNSIENVVEKGETAHNKAICSFPIVFSTLSEKFPPFLGDLRLSSTYSLSLEESKICHLGKG